MFQALYVVFNVAHRLVQFCEPWLVPICLVFAWLIVAIALLNGWRFLRDGVNRTQTMHQIPCANCRFFTGDYRLKCTVNPAIALSEEAIHCGDYESADRLAGIDWSNLDSH
jgi:hypothetical protein